MDDEGNEDATLLGVLLDHHPAQLARFELARELAWSSFEVDDAVARLACAGLVHQHGGFVFATQAAVRFHGLGV